MTSEAAAAGTTCIRRRRMVIGRLSSVARVRGKTLLSEVQAFASMFVKGLSPDGIMIGADFRRTPARDRKEPHRYDHQNCEQPVHLR